MGLFGFGKKKKSTTLSQVTPIESIGNTRVEIEPEPPHESRVLSKYKTAIYWATVDTHGKIDENDLQQWAKEVGADQWKYNFRSRESEGLEVTPGIPCECVVFFDEEPLFNEVIASESFLPIDGKPFFNDGGVFAEALKQKEIVWRADRGLRPLTEEDYEYNVDEDWD